MRTAPAADAPSAEPPGDGYSVQIAALNVRGEAEAIAKRLSAKGYSAYVLTPVTWLFGPLEAWLLLPWVSLPLAIKVVSVVRHRTDGPSLNGALARTGVLQLCFCILLSAGLLLSR